LRQELPAQVLEREAAEKIAQIEQKLEEELSILGSFD
jgi:hypothetical protein